MAFSEKSEWNVFSPGTGLKIGSLEETPAAAVPEIYRTSRQAFKRWSGMEITERLSFFRKLRELITEKMDEVAEVISKDTGKVKTEALVADIMPTLDAISHIEKHARKSLSRQKVKTPLLLIGKKSYIEYMARGTVLVISPWNYPFQLSMVPLLNAAAAGNTVIVKPSEVTPLVGVCMEQLFKEAGFPDGVIQFAHGGKELGSALTDGNPDYIFFTGSVRTGKIIGQAAAAKLIPCTLELGGKDPMIVFEDANLERAANAAIWGAFTNSGQVCMSVERLYVQRDIYPAFLEKLLEKTKQLKLGNGESDDIGSMTFPAQSDIVAEHLRDALSKGAVMETGIPPEQWKRDGTYFIPPVILSNCDSSMKIIEEETFGPVLPVIPFDGEDEAVTLANGSLYGLNASVWSGDADKAARVGSRLVSGAVILNDVLISVANHHLPFGGTKQSGIGRYHGEAGLRMFCHEKAIMSDRGKTQNEIQWYPYEGKYLSFLSMFQHYYGKRTNWAGFAKEYLALLKKGRKK